MSDTRTDHGTHNSDGIEQGLLHESIFHAIFVTLVPSSKAPTYRTPRPIYVRTAAAKQQIVVELVFAYCWASTSQQASASAFDGEDCSSVVCGKKNVSTESVCVGLPTNAMILRSFRQLYISAKLDLVYSQLSSSHPDHTTPPHPA